MRKVSKSNVHKRQEYRRAVGKILYKINDVSKNLSQENVIDFCSAYFSVEKLKLRKDFHLIDKGTNKDFI